jgi:hypothetical protein
VGSPSGALVFVGAGVAVGSGVADGAGARVGVGGRGGGVGGGAGVEHASDAATMIAADRTSIQRSFVCFGTFALGEYI